MVKNVGHKWEV